MAILHPWLWRVARLIASHPRARAKTAEVFDKQVRPRAEDAWRKAKPKLEAARDELRDIARETDPRAHPGEFASKLKQRFLDRKGRR